MNEKVVFIGAGSAIFTRGTVYDMIERGWEGEIALVDVNADALEVTRRLIEKMIVQSGSKLKLSASTRRRDLLPGATVVIATIAVGSRRAREIDVGIPRRYGIYMPVGDSVMTGGAIRAMRMVPEMVAIARDVEALCPEALFVNYSNPMSVLCRAVRQATGVKLIGLCHGVLETAAHVADCLGIRLEEMDFCASGVNHLTFFTHIRHRNEDCMPRLLLEAARRAAGIYPDEETERKITNLAGTRRSIPLATPNPFSWHLTCLHRAFPAAMDRHVVEFFPEIFAREKGYYGKTLGVDAFRFEDALTGGANLYEETRRLALSPKPLSSEFFAKIEGEHEQAVSIIESLRLDQGRIFYANLPNQGQLPGLPAGAIVESPAIVDANGFHPVICPELTPALKAYLVRHMSWVEVVVDAALRQDRDGLAEAIALDGILTDLESIRRLADELLLAQQQLAKEA